MATEQEIKDIIASVPLRNLFTDAGLEVSSSGMTKCISGTHPDNTASMKINDTSNKMSCYACNLSGNSIDFYKIMKGYGFRDSMEELAKQSGMEWPPASEKKYGKDVITPEMQKNIDWEKFSKSVESRSLKHEKVQKAVGFKKDKKLSAFSIGFIPYELTPRWQNFVKEQEQKYPGSTACVGFEIKENGDVFGPDKFVWAVKEKSKITGFVRFGNKEIDGEKNYEIGFRPGTREYMGCCVGYAQDFPSKNVRCLNICTCPHVALYVHIRAAKMGPAIFLPMEKGYKISSQTYAKLASRTQIRFVGKTENETLSFAYNILDKINDYEEVKLGVINSTDDFETSNVTARFKYMSQLILDYVKEKGEPVANRFIETLSNNEKGEFYQKLLTLEIEKAVKQKSINDANPEPEKITAETESGQDPGFNDDDILIPVGSAGNEDDDFYNGR